MHRILNLNRRLSVTSLYIILHVKTMSSVAEEKLHAAGVG